MIGFEVDVSGVLPWRKAIDAAAFRAASKAGGDAIRAMRAEGSRNIRGRKAMRVAYVNKALTLRYPTQKLENLQWAVVASGGIMPVMAFFKSQPKRGARVEINKGSAKIIPHAFKATMKSGHVGVFMRYGTAFRQPKQHGKGFDRYRGQKRQPIKELFTTRVSEAFVDAVPAMAQKGTTKFRESFERLLRVETQKAR